MLAIIGHTAFSRYLSRLVQVPAHVEHGAVRASSAYGRL